MQIKKIVIHYPYVYKERNEILKETILKVHPHKGTFQCLVSIEKKDWNLRGCKYWIKGPDDIYTQLPSAGYHDILANGKFQQYPFLFPEDDQEGKSLLERLTTMFIFYAKEKGLKFDPTFKEPVKKREYSTHDQAMAIAANELKLRKEILVKPSGTFKRFQDFKEYKAKKNT